MIKKQNVNTKCCILISALLLLKEFTNSHSEANSQIQMEAESSTDGSPTFIEPAVWKVNRGVTVLESLLKEDQHQTNKKKKGSSKRKKGEKKVKKEKEAAKEKKKEQELVSSGMTDEATKILND